MHTYFFQILFPYKLLPNMEQCLVPCTVQLVPARDYLLTLFSIKTSLSSGLSEASKGNYVYQSGSNQGGRTEVSSGIRNLELNLMQS